MWSLRPEIPGAVQPLDSRRGPGDECAMHSSAHRMVIAALSRSISVYLRVRLACLSQQHTAWAADFVGRFFRIVAFDDPP